MNARTIPTLIPLLFAAATGAAACSANEEDPTSSAESSDSAVARDGTGSQDTTPSAVGEEGGRGQGSGGASNGTGGVAGAGVAGTNGSDTEAGLGGSGGFANVDGSSPDALGGRGGMDAGGPIIDAGMRDANEASRSEAGGVGPVSLFDGTTLSGWLPSSGTGVGNAPGTWDILDSSLHATGTVRGTLISKNDYGNFRLIFNVRQLPSTGTDNHYASVLIWGTRPPPNDAIGGIQFGNPNGYAWDYRPGHNNNGAGLFVATSGGYSRTAWAQCEILTHVATGVARMACCSLGAASTCRATEVLRFTDITAGKTGPIALQTHSVGGHDEYKNITIEENPTLNDLITTK